MRNSTLKWNTRNDFSSPFKISASWSRGPRIKFQYWGTWEIVLLVYL